MRNPYTEDAEIKVDVDHRVIVLEGRVETPTAKRVAGDDAWGRSPAPLTSATSSWWRASADWAQPASEPGRAEVVERLHDQADQNPGPCRPGAPARPLPGRRGGPRGCSAAAVAGRPGPRRRHPSRSSDHHVPRVPSPTPGAVSYVTLLVRPARRRRQWRTRHREPGREGCMTSDGDATARRAQEMARSSRDHSDVRDRLEPLAGRAPARGGGSPDHRAGGHLRHRHVQRDPAAVGLLAGAG
jgi:hypothetical protein